MINGIKRLSNFLNKDISITKKPSWKKLKAKQQYQLIKLLHNLSLSGFNLNEMVSFLEKAHLLEDHFVQRMKVDLMNGRDISEMMAHLGFSDALVTQLSLAEVHGNTTNCLAKIEDYMAQSNRIRQKTIEVITYPMVLMTFLIVILMGLRHYLLPQIGEENQLTHFLNLFPTVLLLTFFAMIAVVIFLRLCWRKKSQLKQLLVYSKIPLLSAVLQLYLTAYYAREWGNLIAQGVELATILQLMQKEKSVLMREMGSTMEKALLEGKSFDQSVGIFPFFKRELSLMIEYGEIKGKLGQELDIYAQVSWENYFRKLRQMTQWLQPLIFILVAIIIVMIYAAMLLPMYQTIGGEI
ncbi:competence type IV pilus assembly protein ComGB [Streptococcus uberis]|uniref:competence type IV pilus assembly protein ComGB n=1 Tax=Streptococcus uberis TaxID=1349 RepID=UPI0015F129C3|nr:competence type IV pilus assembly protein ComGB [Streptococcus uberis]